MTLTAKEVQTLSTQFKDAGIKARIEKPDEDEDLMIEILSDKDETVLISPGKVDIKVFVDKEHKQLVMWADEKARDITQICSAYHSHTITSGDRARLKKDFEGGRNFTMRLPTGTTYEMIGKVVKGVSGKPFPDPDHAGLHMGEAYVYAKVTAHVPESNQTFLIGTDETSQFVCGLPTRVRTVKAAHKALRPPGIPANCPRQGEWFFVPATATEKKLIEAHIAKDLSNLGSTWLGDTLNIQHSSYYKTVDSYRDDGDSTHAAVLSVNLPTRKTPRSNPTFTTFVRGYIVDDRRSEGRESRHDPLWLNDWHRPVHNLEEDMPGQDSDTWD